MGRRRAVRFASVVALALRGLAAIPFPLGRYDANGVAGRFEWLGRIAVLGPLDRPAGHLALDHTWVGAQPAFPESLGEDLGYRLLMSCVERSGGKIPAEFGRCGEWPEGFG